VGWKKTTNSETTPPQCRTPTSLNPCRLISELPIMRIEKWFLYQAVDSAYTKLRGRHDRAVSFGAPVAHSVAIVLLGLIFGLPRESSALAQDNSDWTEPLPAFCASRAICTTQEVRG
jgi:hypothetical protein